MIVADTSGLLALFNQREPRHHEVRDLVETTADPLVVSPYVVAELDYLVAGRLGVRAELAVLAELSGGAYELAGICAVDLQLAQQIVEQYSELAIGVTDASLVVLADRLRTRRILTLDHRHFDVLRPLAGGQFEVLP